MNLSTGFSISLLLNAVIGDYATTIPQVDDTHSVYEVVAQELCVRVMAAFFTVFGAASGIVNSIQDLLELNIGVSYSRGVLSFAMFKVNVIFLKILAVGVLSLAGAIVMPHYVHPELKVLDGMRHDFCRLLTELPEDLESLARSVDVELPAIHFYEWREKLAQHLEASLPEIAEPLLDSSIEPPSFINFHPTLYKTALTDLLTELQEETELAEEAKSRNTSPERVANWINSKIAEQPDYKKLLKFYAKEHKKIPTEKNPQVNAMLKVMARARLETAFDVKEAALVKKKMRSLYLLLHPDKTRFFTEKRQKQLTELFTFVQQFTNYALH